MEENLMQERPVERSCGVAGYEFFNRELHDPTDLPLLVWLRGDEPYFDSFTLDADQVMNDLGIKRSRLTQISGKELRVGRKRDGRYVRPVYRAEDVAAYKEWSRAPATQVRSTELVTEMMDRFEENIQNFSNARKEILEEFKDFLTPELIRTQREVFWKIESLEHFHADRLNAVQQQTRDHLNTLVQSLNEVSTARVQDFRNDLSDLWKSSMEKLLQIETTQRELMDYNRMMVEKVQESLHAMQNHFTTEIEQLRESTTAKKVIRKTQRLKPVVQKASVMPSGFSRARASRVGSKKLQQRC